MSVIIWTNVHQQYILITQKWSRYSIYPECSNLLNSAWVWSPFVELMILTLSNLPIALLAYYRDRNNEKIRSPVIANAQTLTSTAELERTKTANSVTLCVTLDFCSIHINVNAGDWRRKLIFDIPSCNQQWFRSPVFAVWQQVSDNVTGCVSDGDDVAFYGDAVGNDLGTVTARLVPGERQTGGWKERLAVGCGWWVVQKMNSRYYVRYRGGGSTGHKLTVGARPCVIHRLPIRLEVGL